MRSLKRNIRRQSWVQVSFWYALYHWHLQFVSVTHLLDKWAAFFQWHTQVNECASITCATVTVSGVCAWWVSCKQGVQCVHDECLANKLQKLGWLSWCWGWDSVGFLGSTQRPARCNDHATKERSSLSQPWLAALASTVTNKGLPRKICHFWRLWKTTFYTRYCCEQMRADKG